MFPFALGHFTIDISARPYTLVIVDTSTAAVRTTGTGRRICRGRCREVLRRDLYVRVRKLMSMLMGGVRHVMSSGSVYMSFAGNMRTVSMASMRRREAVNP